MSWLGGTKLSGCRIGAQSMSTAQRSQARTKTEGRSKVHFLGLEELHKYLKVDRVKPRSAILTKSTAQLCWLLGTAVEEAVLQ